MQAICPRHGVVELRREEYLKWWECPEACPYVLPDDMVGSTELMHWTVLVSTWPWTGRRQRHSA